MYVSEFTSVSKSQCICANWLLGIMCHDEEVWVCCKKNSIEELTKTENCFQCNTWSGHSSGLPCSRLYISLLHRNRKEPCYCDVQCALESSCSFLLYFRILDFPITFSMPFPPSSKHHSFFNSERRGSAISAVFSEYCQ